MKYFIKEVLSNPCFTSDGRPIAFESLAGNSGVIALDETKPENESLIADLTKMNGRMGIIACSEDEYSRKKLTAASLKSKSPSDEWAALAPSALPSPAQHGAAPVAAVEVPIIPPSTPLSKDFKPRVGRTFRPRVIPGPAPLPDVPKE